MWNEFRWQIIKENYSRSIASLCCLKYSNYWTKILTCFIHDFLGLLNTSLHLYFLIIRCWIFLKKNHALLWHILTANSPAILRWWNVLLNAGIDNGDIWAPWVFTTVTWRNFFKSSSQFFSQILIQTCPLLLYLLLWSMNGFCSI